MDPVINLLTELEVELHGKARWSYWVRAIKNARQAYRRMTLAFDDQSRELQIACDVMTPEQLTEYRHRAYPKLYPRT